MGFAWPRVTINIENGNGEGIGKLSTVSVGYGLHQTWVFSSVYSTGMLFSPAYESVKETQLYLGFSPIFLTSIVTLFLMLMICAWNYKAFARANRNRRLLIIAALLSFVGTNLAFFYTPDAAGRAVIALDGIMTGLGSAVLYLLWGSFFTRTHPSTTALNAAFSIVITAFAFSIVALAPYPFAGIFVGLIPLIELALLWRRVPRLYEEDPSLSGPYDAPVNRRRLLAVFGAPMFLLGFSLGYLRDSFTGAMLTSASAGMTLATLTIAGVLAAVAIFIIGAFHGNARESSWSSYYNIVMSLAALAIVLGAAFPSGTSLATDALFVIAYFCFEVVTLISFAAISQNYGIPSVLVFGIGRSALAVTSALAMLLPNAAEVLPTPFSDVNYAIMALTLVCLLVGVSILPRHETLEQVAGGKTDGGTAEDPARDRKPGAESEPARVPPMEEPAATAAPQQPVASTRAAGPEAKAEPEAPASLSDVQSNCKLVAKHYLLSQRESEVLYLLAIGRNSAYIQQTLYVSEGTAKTHIRHIYRKLNVHKQQELMTIVENAGKELA